MKLAEGFQFAPEFQPVTGDELRATVGKIPIVRGGEVPGPRFLKPNVRVVKARDGNTYCHACGLQCFIADDGTSCSFGCKCWFVCNDASCAKCRAGEPCQ